MTPGDLVLLPGRDPLRHAGGSESYVTGAALSAAHAGWAPHIFAVDGRRTTVAPFGPAVLHRVATPVRPVRSINAMLQRPWLVRAIVAQLRDRPGVHVLHAFGAWAAVAVAARRSLAEHGVPSVVVATMYTPIGHEAAAKRDSEVVQADRRLRARAELELAWVRRVTVPSERRALVAADLVLVNYDSVTRLLEEAYGPIVTPRRITYAAATAFDPVPDLPEPPAGVPPGDTPLLLTVSRHDGRKGLDRFLRALAVLRDEGLAFRACLVGTGTLLEPHRQLTAELGLTDRVALPGRVPEVMPYLRACDVYVLPSTQEGSGSVAALEAMQAGAAIVSTAVDGMPEDLTDGVDALLPAPGSVPELAAALRRMLTEPDERARFGAAARALYERRFSPDVAAAELDAAYRAALATRPR